MRIFWNILNLHKIIILARCYSAVILGMYNVKKTKSFFFSLLDISTLCLNCLKLTIYKQLRLEQRTKSISHHRITLPKYKYPLYTLGVIEPRCLIKYIYLVP